MTLSTKLAWLDELKLSTLLLSAMLPLVMLLVFKGIAKFHYIFNSLHLALSVTGRVY